jgi:hypothetical protein
LAEKPDIAEFEFETIAADALTAAQRDHVFGLFDACYRQANHAYLEKSLARLRFVSLAASGGKPAGFGLAEAQIMDLPRLAQQTVILAGLSCVAPEFRRLGLFGRLEAQAIRASDLPWSDRILMCGRMAHPAAFRVMSSNPTAVPAPARCPTPWHREVGQAIADAYGVETFDPEHFVCVGSGTPIGFPILDLDLEPWEWEVFQHIDRERGDSLLGIAWSPDAPPGW